MTHDELMAKLLVSDKTDVYKTLRLWQTALYAVVELHKPVGNAWNKVLNCTQCKSTDDEYNRNWPCPTIIAIERELS